MNLQELPRAVNATWNARPEHDPTEPQPDPPPRRILTCKASMNTAA